MGIIWILMFGYIGSVLFERLRLTKVLGLLVVGVLIGPMVFNMIDGVILDYSNEIRKVALMIVLTRAGLSLKWHDLKEIGKPALLLSFLPAIFEIVAITFAAFYFLNFSLVEGLVLGCVIAAVSPAIIVPRMIKMIEGNKGTDKHIPQMIMTGASVDDIFVVVLFSAASTMALTSNFNFIELINVPISIIVGIAFGLVLGRCYEYIFNRIKSKWILSLGLFIITFVLLFAEKQLNQLIPIAILLTIMSLGFMIRHKNSKIADKIAIDYNCFWKVAEIFLFVLLGASINIELLSLVNIAILAVLLIGLIFRTIGVLVSIKDTNLNKKERLFCVLSYMPKATVQATLGGLPLAMGIATGNWILIIAIFSIVLTAPLSALLLDYYIKRLFIN